jgi:imidazolonepropionase-like amidohydrolase
VQLLTTGALVGIYGELPTVSIDRRRRESNPRPKRCRLIASASARTSGCERILAGLSQRSEASVNRFPLIFSVVAVLALTSPALAQDSVRSREEAERLGHLAVESLPDEPAPSFVLRGGTVLTAAGERLEPGYVVVKNGRIESVGVGEPPAQGSGVSVIELKGQFVTPGLIDSHSHLGVYSAPGFQGLDDGNEATAPVTAGVWAEHALWPQDPGIEMAVAGGVTSMLVLPGSANLVGGRGVAVHLVPARGSRAMRFPGAPDVLKMACGENPKRVYGEKNAAPSTRMGNLRGQREAFFAAQKYRDDWRRFTEKAARPADPNAPKKKKGAPEPEAPAPPTRDLGLETLAEVLDGRVLVEWHCYRADDMLDAIQLADEVGFKVRAFHHALEAYKIRDILAAKGIAVATWADWWGFKIEAFDGIEENAALITEAGGRVAIKSDSPIDIQRLNQEAGKAFASAKRSGVAMTENDALRMVTANPAWILGIDDQVGTIEKGKRADLVVWDAHPFSVYAHARLVFVDGRLRYDRARRDEPWSDYMLGQETAP